MQKMSDQGSAWLYEWLTWFQMLTDVNRRELEELGYTVVENVLSDKECDDYVGEYKTWISQFKDGNWPYTKSSLIFDYNIGNMEATWKIRLKTKRVFAEVWGTDKLLSSIDTVAIGRPPESGDEDFAEDTTHWLHTDQSVARVGLHAYQGVVYLEEADYDDWTFHLMKGSHKYLQEFYDNNPKQAVESTVCDYYQLCNEDYDWFKSKGCKTLRVPVPKGGMALWDSRLIHANARPMRGRKHPGRWRFTTFVCMSPAIWATEEDLSDRKEAYENVCMTSHWPSQGVRYSMPDGEHEGIEFPLTLPEVATTAEARRLWGVLPYDYNDGRPNGPEPPIKIADYRSFE